MPPQSPKSELCIETHQMGSKKYTPSGLIARFKFLNLAIVTDSLETWIYILLGFFLQHRGSLDCFIDFLDITHLDIVVHMPFIICGKLYVGLIQCHVLKCILEGMLQIC